MSGFYFNGQAIEGHAGYLDGDESYDDDDDEEEEEGEEEEYREESSQGYEPGTSDDEDGSEADPDEYGGGGHSRIGPLPQMGSGHGHRGQASNNSEQTIEDLDKMLSRPPPKLSHFVSDDLPSLTEERRRLRLEQYQPPKPAQQRQRHPQRQRQQQQQQQQRSPQRDGFDTNLLNEAFAYVKKLTGTVNSKALMAGAQGGGGGGGGGSGGGSASAGGSRRKKKKKKGQSAASHRPLAQGSALRAARAAGGRGRGKGQKGPRKLNTQYGRGQSRVNNKAGKAAAGKLGLKKTMNQRVKERLHDEAFKKSGAKGPSPDMQQLIEQFETGSTISALRDELRRAKESETTSAEFIATARRQWLQ